MEGRLEKNNHWKKTFIIALMEGKKKNREKGRESMMKKGETEVGSWRLA